MNIIKNRHLINSFALILIFGLIVGIGLKEVAFSGGEGADFGLGGDTGLPDRLAESPQPPGPEGGGEGGGGWWGDWWSPPPSAGGGTPPPSASASASCAGSEAQVNISWAYSGSCDHVDASISGGPSGAPSILGQPCNGSHIFEHLASNTNYNYNVAFYYTGQIIQGSFGTPNCMPPPPTVDLWGPSTVEVPNPINLGWSSSNTNSCTASGDWSGGKATNGSESISKSRGQYSFVITCTGAGGTAQDRQNTQVIQVPRCDFNADPANIILPATSALSWDCAYPGGGTSAISCEIDQGIGDVDPRVGFVEVRPSEGTTYTLTCIGQDGSRSFRTSVEIGFTPRLKEILPRP
jgi:hypothetical protein